MTTPIQDYAPCSESSGAGRIPRAHEQAVTAVEWPPGGGLVAGAAADSQVAVWRPRRAVPGSPAATVDLVVRDSAATAVELDGKGRLAGWADFAVAAHIVDGT